MLASSFTVRLPWDAVPALKAGAARWGDRILQRPVSSTGHAHTRHKDQGEGDRGLSFAEVFGAGTDSENRSHGNVTHSNRTLSNENQGGVLSSLRIRVQDLGAMLTPGVDEGYTLSIPSKSCEAVLEAATIYGAMHGLQSLAQLVSFDAGQVSIPPPSYYS